MTGNFVYIVKCRDGTYYCGWTDRLLSRIDRHNSGLGAKYTRSRRPVRLVYYERYLTKHDAMSREWHIKRLTRTEKQQLIRQNGALLPASGLETAGEYAGDGQLSPVSLPDTVELGAGFIRINPADGPGTRPAIRWFARRGLYRFGILGQHDCCPVCADLNGSILYLAPSLDVFLEMPEKYIEAGMLLCGVINTEKERKGNMDFKEALDYIRQACGEMEMYKRANAISTFDLETICPEMGKEEQGNVNAFLETQAFRIRQAPAFTEAVETVYDRLEELSEPERVLVASLHRTYLYEKNITPEMKHSFAMTYNRAYINWERAKRASDFSLFRDSLADVLAVEQKKIAFREHEPDEAQQDAYNQMLGDYERGMDTKTLDACFETCKARLIPLLRRIQASPKTIRTDFLSRPVSDEAQRRLAEYLLATIGFDMKRGLYTLTEHPFTMDAGRNNVRVTTHFYPNNFCSNLFSIMHEGGHALFAQLDKQEHYDAFISGERTLGMDESVSRFYENRIGRSKPFIHLIYPEVRKIMHEAMADVTEQEFYEAVNLCTPSLIRIEADEFTYTFHIIIRYEIEKELISGRIGIDEIPARWREMYREYLGVEPQNDREGALQDVHWASGFGYFPTYSLGNMYNAMYVNRMRREIDLDQCILAGDFKTINTWMQEHVFARADLERPLEWIQNICGRPFTPDDFLDYLEEKYSELYELH